MQLAMNRVLREAQKNGRRPTITAVEKHLDVKHATFYRNFPHLIDWFREQAQLPATPAVPEMSTPLRKTQADTIADLRRENTQLRRAVTIYAEALRQLSLDYEESRSQREQILGVTDLANRRTRLK
ncbi:hypothetical protein [Streptomyces yangpuensis]|uniref:hypothetical protein n=1 Tax=Streptomyces yangpuensis TaxID=1648182 RepID=UPI0036A5D078